MQIQSELQQISHKQHMFKYQHVLTSKFKQIQNELIKQSNANKIA